ncbi:MAG TPA: NAD-binding protein [Thermoanaerobaculia bacterium]|nr:NAD-binding protein [Thermoanaerobaculia bacterium]
MSRSRRRLLLLLAAVPVLVLLLALLYQAGMAALEGQRRGFWDSVLWAASTLTTTGYGLDHQWRHPAMVVYVTVVQFLGLFMVYLIFPIFFIPFLEERFEVRLPQESPRDMAHHVVIYRHGPAVETLISELTAARVPTLVLEPDEAAARRLHEGGLHVVHRGQVDGALAAARLDRARALIVNGTDDENAAAILEARQLGFGGPLLALVEDPYHRRPMMLAGATAAFTPRHILGAALAARASARISPRLAGVQQLGRNLLVAEVKVTEQSPLAGMTLEEAGIGARTGATVIGQWRGGELTMPSGGGWRLEPDGILVVVGSHDSIEKLGELAGAGDVLRRRHGHFVVGGYGEVGRKVVELLRTVGEEVRVIERHPASAAGAPAADSPEGAQGLAEVIHVAGNVLELQVLEAAGVRDAQAVVLALDTDSATLFATVILKDLAPDVPVIARVNQADNVDRIHRAGAYFALSISQISGQMLAKKLLGQEAFAVDPQLKVRKLAALPLAGRHPSELRIRGRTGCSVVAVERGEAVLVDFGPAFKFQRDDTIYICGSGRAVQRFAEVFRLPEAVGQGNL